MTREEVIKYLEWMYDHAEGWHINGQVVSMPLTKFERTCEDAIALLKAQEPVKPKFIDTSNSKLYHSNMFQNYCCGNCGEFLHIMSRNDLFCSQCGRAVKWE